jgi:hypothetical protein
MKKQYRVCAIGDIHGRVNWKEIVAKEVVSDRIIFMGDYFDTHNAGVSGNKQLVNFKEILAFKRANPEQVVMLFGNHDYHYIPGMASRGETYSGYQGAYAHDFGEAIQDALSDDSVQMCWIYDKFVFSHAGLTKTWCQRVLGSDEARGELLQTAVNDMFKFQPLAFGFMMGDNFSQTGNDVCQGPIWVRPQSLIPDMLDGITCVVGHTTVTQLGLREELPNIILIDCLGTSGEYLIIEDGIPKSSE